jgi:hypothetical protein
MKLGMKLGMKLEMEPGIKREAEMELAISNHSHRQLDRSGH